MRIANPNEYPRTYRAQTGDNLALHADAVFDPALKQYPRAFRLAPPRFETISEQARWLSARQQVMGHLLRMIAASPWHDSLVLRGSLLLKAWLGDAAREPGDIDWVVRPASASITDPMVSHLFAYLSRAGVATIGSGITIATDRIAVDDIWTYERVPGKRIVFPWTLDGESGGAVQMDFVFGETLRTAPALTPIMIGGDTIPIWAATPEESLAWKVLWLENDSYPQGKDLYDAVLLAERIHLPWTLLQEVLLSDDEYRVYGQNRELLTLTYIEWDDFKREYPEIEGDLGSWTERLKTALIPTLAERALTTP